MNLRQIFSKPEATPEPTPPCDRIREICKWFRDIEAEEARYFAAADECGSAWVKLGNAAASLRAQLREEPDVERFLELARTEAELKALGELRANDVFWIRRDRFNRRSAMHPEARATIAELPALARSYVAPLLESARAEDEKLTAKIGARDPIVSAETRRLEQILESADQVEAKLREDSDSFPEWTPFAGLCAALEPMTQSQPDEEGFSGQYRYLHTGEIFALKVLPDSEARTTLTGERTGQVVFTQKRTHVARSASGSWDGTAEDFEREFQKV